MGTEHHRSRSQHLWTAVGLAASAALAITIGCNAITGLGDYEVVTPTGAGATSAGGGGTSAGGNTSSGGNTTSNGGAGGATPDCQNGTLDPGEEDVDCGGPCPPCPCQNHGDCASEACINDFCAEIVQIATGSGHACAVLGDGTAYCWGQNDDGQLGDGGIVDHFNPQPVSGLAGAAGISLSRRPDNATRGHSCAWLDDGSVACWGRNEYGQVGTGSTGGTVTAPTVVSGLTNVQQLALGRHHSCARQGDGTMLCWGRNDHGQIGDGSVVTAPSPVSVLSGVAQLAVCNYATCAALTTGGVLCWGRNDLHQLGLSDVSDTLLPTAVPGLSGISDIAQGKAYGCARSGASSVWCWGDNSSGQLATGDTTAQPQPTAISALSQIAQLSLGVRIGYTSTAPGGHACAVHSDGSLSCWGRNSNGQLGDGSTAGPVLSPQTITGLTDVAEVATGVDYTCARLVSGALRCWGRNTEGQLGVGSAGANITSPTPVVWP